MAAPPDAAARDAAAAREVRERLAADVRFYLQQAPRQLPSRLLYDALGSALFDAICQLPWYRITRAELALLARHARAIGRAVGPGGRFVELGGGNGEKLAMLLANGEVPDAHVHLIDLSAAALDRATQAFAILPAPPRRVTTHLATYEDGLLAVPAADAPPTLVAFLGSNIGNFDAPGAAALLRLVRAALRPGDLLLLGADLVKPERDLELAYDDPLGVTAAFNKNLLVRLNRDLGGDFVLDRFGHRAVWRADASRVEMHLVSLVRQDVRIEDAQLHFTLDEGETIWTESSYKFDAAGIRGLVEPAGFARREQWIDEEAAFALTLFSAT